MSARVNRWRFLMVVLMLFSSVSLVSAAPSDPDKEKVNPDLPGPTMLRIDNLTLEEYDKELERIGIPKSGRDKLVKEEEERRKKGQPIKLNNTI